MEKNLWNHPDDEWFEKLGIPPGAIYGAAEEGLVRGYRSWLFNLIAGEGRFSPDGESYRALLSILWYRDFYWTIPHDDNRANGGIALRERYLLEKYNSNEEGSPQAPSFVYHPNNKLWMASDRIAGIDLVPQRPCSILEMLIALSQKMEFQMYNGESDVAFSNIFWELLGNLRLLQYKDGVLKEEKVLEIHKKLDNFLDRTYSRTGKGGLFPLKRPTEDQRTLEIWYQMQKYLCEKRSK